MPCNSRLQRVDLAMRSRMRALGQARACDRTVPVSRAGCRTHARPCHSCSPISPCNQADRINLAAALKNAQDVSIGDSAASGGATSNEGILWSSWWLQRQTLVMFSAGAVLGPFLDGMHSSNNVLHYHDPFVFRVEDWSLESCWWVPVLFGVAGAIIGVGVPVLDTLLINEPFTTNKTTATTGPRETSPVAQVAKVGADGQTGAGTAPSPTWSTVLLCIALFVTQYWISGKLEGLLLDSPYVLDGLLLVYAAVHFAWFDRTAAGLVLSVATMVGGPLIEVFLVNVPQLYHYEHPVLWGVPTWIPWVYFCGGPAVGNLGRKVSATLIDKRRGELAQQ